MANRARGEVSLTIGDQAFTVCLTLGTLAELEDALKVESFNEVFTFPDKLSAKYIINFMKAVLRGNKLDESLADQLTIPQFKSFYADLIEVSGLVERKDAKDQSDGPLDGNGGSAG